MKPFSDMTPLEKLEHIEACINTSQPSEILAMVRYQVKRLRKLEAVAEACKGYQLERIVIAMASSYWEKSPAERSMDDALIALEADA